MTIVKAKYVTLTGGRASLPSVQCGSRIEHTADAAPVRPAEAVPADRGFEQERHTLLARIADLERKLADHQSTAEQQSRAAFERGAETARAEWIRSEIDRVDALRDGIAIARQSVADHLRSLDSLAIDIARGALDKVLGDASSYADLVTSTVRHRIGMLASGAVLEIRVARADFPDATALDCLQAEIPAMPPVKLVADPALTEGACIIGLALGKIDASILLQHERIAAALDEALAND